MKKGFSGSSPQPVQLELAIARTFSMLYLLTIYYRGGVPPQQLDPTYQQTLVRFSITSHSSVGNSKRVLVHILKQQSTPTFPDKPTVEPNKHLNIQFAKNSFEFSIETGEMEESFGIFK